LSFALPLGKFIHDFLLDEEFPYSDGENVGLTYGLTLHCSEWAD